MCPSISKNRYMVG